MRSVWKMTENRLEDLIKRTANWFNRQNVQLIVENDKAKFNRQNIQLIVENDKAQFNRQNIQLIVENDKAQFNGQNIQLTVENDKAQDLLNSSNGRQPGFRGRTHKLLLKKRKEKK